MYGSEKTNTNTQSSISTHENTQENTPDTEKTSSVTFSSKHTDNTIFDTTIDATKNTTNMHGSSSSTLNPLESSGISNNSPSDMTTFLSSTTFTDTDVEKSQNITKDLILRKQLLHDIQKLKIELSQKNLLVDTLKADHLNVVDDLEDKLSDAVHTKQLIQAKFETQMRIMQNENNNELKRLKVELQESAKLQKSYQIKYQEIYDKTGDIKSAFVQMELNEEEYFVLKGKSIESLTTSEYFAVGYKLLLLLYIILFIIIIYYFCMD